MWRTLLAAVLCCVGVLSHNVNSNEKEISIKSDVLLKGNVQPDLREEVELESIFYRTNLNPEIPYIIESDLEHKQTSSEEDSSEEEDEPTFQPWSILWYIGSFGGLIAFFLVVSCSEWCCRSRRRRDSETSTCASPTPSEAPPPAYDLFAPPAYDSLCTNSGVEKRNYDVFIVELLEENQGVHGEEPTAPPPAYSESRANLTRNSDEVVLAIARIEEQQRTSAKGETDT